MPNHWNCAIRTFYNMPAGFALCESRKSPAVYQQNHLAEENRKLNEQADKTITANQQAAQAANTHQQSVKALGDVMEENRKTGQRLGEEMGELTKQHKQQN